MFVPVDVVKERLQVQSLGEPSTLTANQLRVVSSTGIPVYSSSWDAFVKIMKMEGMRGVYKVKSKTTSKKYSYFMFHHSGILGNSGSLWTLLCSLLFIL